MHGIRTENYRTPRQMFISGTLRNADSDTSAMNNIFRMDASIREQLIDDFRNDNQFNEPEDIGNVLDRIPPPLTDAELQELRMLVDPLAQSPNGGVDLYANAVRFVMHCARN